jgi:hypothetical protein
MPNLVSDSMAIPARKQRQTVTQENIFPTIRPTGDLHTIEGQGLYIVLTAEEDTEYASIAILTKAELEKQGLWHDDIMLHASDINLGLLPEIVDYVYKRKEKWYGNQGNG